MLSAMRRTAVSSSLTLAWFLGGSPALLVGQACPSQEPLALVLSGGGAKGLAHIGVLRVLDSLGIRPDLVVGTSMGSIVGSMYASGSSPDQIEEQARSLGLAQMFARTDPRTPRSLGERRPLVVWQPGGGGFRTAEAGAREAAVSAAINRVLLRGNLAARGSFDSLPVPFRAIATDLRTRAEVTLSGGDLARAVRASMAIPLVFDPQRIGGRDLVDGGLAANVPIAAARRAGATRVIVSDVGWRPPDSVRADDPLAVADLLVAYLFTQPRDSLGPGDQLVRPEVDSFAALDFAPKKMAEIIKRGHDAAAAAFAGHPVCSGAIPVRLRRTTYRVRAVRIVEGPAKYAGLVSRQLGIVEGDWLNVPGLQERMKALSETDDYREVWLQPSGAPDSLTLSLAIRPAPARTVVVGLSYDNDIGGQMWVGASDRGSLLRGLESSTTLALGELRQELGVGFRPASGRLFPGRPVLSGVIAREVIRQFTPSGGAAPEIRTKETWGVLGFEARFGREWLVTLGGYGHAWDAPGSSRTGGLGGLVRVSSGPRYRPNGIWGEGVLTNAYRRVAVEVRHTIHLGARVDAAPEVRFGWGKDLPLQRTFPLGGLDGFPGLNIGERRGDREAMAQLVLRRPILGPVHLRLTAASGQTAVGGSTLPRGRWVSGGRAGLGADTPIGPIRVEYGVATGGRNGVFLRLGEWY
jgi:NTE family protein